MLAFSGTACTLGCIKKRLNISLQGNTFLQNPTHPRFYKLSCQRLQYIRCLQNAEEKPKLKWVKTESKITEFQKQSIARLPKKMTNRCKALMKEIICYSSENTSLPVLLAKWVKNTKPRRADWLSVLKELSSINHPLYFEVAELALLEETLEVNIRDYTKIIHGYAKENRLQDAENALAAMKNKGFICDQVILTSLIHMYSKSNNLHKAEETFEDMKLLSTPLDKRSYGSMIMAYIRAQKLTEAENLLIEMDSEEIYAGREVYKALLRAHSMNGDSKSAQRIFNMIQLAGIVPDVKLCGLLINAYVAAGQCREARIAFDNLLKAGIKPNDKCVALILSGFEKDKNLPEALDFLMHLEKIGLAIEEEGSGVLAKWFRDLGVVDEVNAVLTDYVANERRVPLKV